MADLRPYITIIQNAHRGEEVRDAIINACNLINEEDHSMQLPDLWHVMTTGKINGVDIYDTTPIPGSKRAVQSKGLYEIVKLVEQGLDLINGEVA